VPQAASDAANMTDAIAFRLGVMRASGDDRVSAMKHSKSKAAQARAGKAKSADTKVAARTRPQRGAESARASSAAKSSLESGLYVVATPIGNLRDMSLRAMDVLGAADLVFAEDTRVSGKLMAAHGLKPKMHSYHEHNADVARLKALKALEEGKAVALISDAGTPLVSDPGFKLVRAAIAAGYRVVPIPGASAALAALVVAGLPTDRFLFAGFPPSKEKARRETFEELAGVRATLIFYESGQRLAETLADMSAVFGQRQAAIAREMTKLYEDVRRGLLADLAAAAAMGEAPKGELVVVIGPPEGAAPSSDEAIDAALREALKEMSVSAAADEVSDLLGVQRKRVYTRALAIKDGA
jgi:16S rRNA (cytidine1402-2'-O)-methyltransferase